MAIWFAINGGNWNGSAGADPATGAGGVSLSFVSGLTLFGAAIVNGGATGDNVTVNFGGSAFAHAIPAGFAAYGAAVTLDPATVVNGALSGGNLTLTETSIGAGGAFATAGLAPGTKAYFEITLNHVQAGSAHITGGGVGRAGAAFAFLATGSGAGNGAFSGGDNNGGATLGFTGSTSSTAIGAGHALAISGMGVAVAGDVIRVAVIVEGAVVEPIADMADLWFSPTSAFVDLSDATNRRKFTDANGCPIYLGANGQLPFNQAPSVFLTAATGNAASFATNAGLGGTFSASGGALQLASKSPCCGITTTVNVNVPLGADPQVMLSVSDDGGRTWNEQTKKRSIGKIGKYLTRVRWLKMGQFRQRIVKLEITDPVKRAIVGFYADIKQGMQ